MYKKELRIYDTKIKENGELLNFFNGKAITGFPRRQLTKSTSMSNNIQIFHDIGKLMTL